MHTVIISGGGTGGHIHPALAIADEIRSRYPGCRIEFVGAVGRMEMEKVPKAGYSIRGLWISGIDRNWKSKRNLLFPFKLISSLVKAGRILRQIRPQLVVGVGGFASGPLLYQASRRGIPTAIQEQNSFPGITNRMLARRVDLICAGFPGLEKWFPTDRIVETGNPLREGVAQLATRSAPDKTEALAHFGFDGQRPILFVMGGSLGAASMNEAVEHLLQNSCEFPCDVLWQCGSRYFEAASQRLTNASKTNFPGTVRCVGFIDRMDWAYLISDIIASRAGAMSIAELALVGKPTVLVPSPVVAEDHQTKNARSLSDRGGAILLADAEVVHQLGTTITNLWNDASKRQALSQRIQEAAKPNAARDVVDALEKLLNFGKP